MAKILIVISHDTYVRNYLRTNALDALREHHECHIVAHRGLSLAEEVSQFPGFHGFYDLDASMEKKHHLLFNLLMWRYRKKSKTFFYRWLRNSNWHLINRSGTLLQRALSYVHWFGAALLNPRGLRIPVMANPLVFPVVAGKLKHSIRANTSVKSLVQGQGFDLIAYPSAAFDSVSVDLVTIGRELGIPTLCLIDNWDNLSSKTVFWQKPDHLGVWGPQAKAQAEEIHGFDAERIHLVGTPRFDSYFAARENKTPQSPYDFPYALYVGSAMPFDDIGTLRKIDKIIQDSPEFPEDFRVVYRPHPWQHKRNTDATFHPEEFSRVTLDSQFEEAYTAGVTAGKTNPGFQPDLDYYPALLLSARFVVGPLTTMLFEASLCLRPVIGLSYCDGFHVNTSRRYFSHFEGMEEVPGFIFCQDELSLERMMSNAFSAVYVDAKTSDSVTGYFLYRDHRPYTTRLRETIDSVLSARNT